MTKIGEGIVSIRHIWVPSISYWKSWAVFTTRSRDEPVPACILARFLPKKGNIAWKSRDEPWRGLKRDVLVAVIVSTLTQRLKRYHLWPLITLLRSKHVPQRLHQVRRPLVQTSPRQRMATRATLPHLCRRSNNNRVQATRSATANSNNNNNQRCLVGWCNVPTPVISSQRHLKTGLATTLWKTLWQHLWVARNWAHHCCLLTPPKHRRVYHTSQAPWASKCDIRKNHGGVSGWIGFILTPPIFHSAARCFASCPAEWKIVSFLYLLCGKFVLHNYRRDLYTVRYLFARSAVIFCVYSKDTFALAAKNTGEWIQLATTKLSSESSQFASLFEHLMS